MANIINYTTVDRVLSKLYRDLGIDEISETDVIEWIGESLELIGVVTLYETKVIRLKVKNHKVEIPYGLHQINQIVKDNTYYEEPPEIPQCSKKKNKNNKCVCKQCSQLPELNMLKRVTVDLQNEYLDFDFTTFKGLEPIRLSNNNFIGSLVCKQMDNVYKSCDKEYTINNGNLLFSFKEGNIIISYLSQKLDEETGYPLIPDDASIISAITYYIIWKYMQRMWYLGREGYSDKMQQAEAQWQWYCKQSSNNLMMLKGIDQYQNFTESKFQTIPKNNRYYGFFGNLGRK